MTKLDKLREAIRRRDLSPATERQYMWQARRFLAAVGKPVEEVNAEDVRRYLADRSSTNGARGLAAILAALRLLFVVTRDEGPLPTDGFAFKRVGAKAPMLLSGEGVKKLLVVAGSASRGRGWSRLRDAFKLRDRACLELLYGLGLRASEVRAARLVDLDLVAGTLLVRRAKRGTSRVFALPPSALPHLKRYVVEGRPALLTDEDDVGFLLLNRYGKPLAHDGVRSIVVRVARIAGMKAHPHAFRRAVATHLVHEGVPVPAVKEFLGHAKLSTTAVYVEVSLEDLRRAVSWLERR